jgi:hypothetical protein
LPTPRTDSVSDDGAGAGAGDGARPTVAAAPFQWVFASATVNQTVATFRFTAGSMLLESVWWYSAPPAGVGDGAGAGAGPIENAVVITATGDATAVFGCGVQSAAVKLMVPVGSVLSMYEKRGQYSLSLSHTHTLSLTYTDADTHSRTLSACLVDVRCHLSLCLCVRGSARSFGGQPAAPPPPPSGAMTPPPPLEAIMRPTASYMVPTGGPGQQS